MFTFCHALLIYWKFRQLDVCIVCKLRRFRLSSNSATEISFGEVQCNNRLTRTTVLTQYLLSVSRFCHQRSIKFNNVHHRIVGRGSMSSDYREFRYRRSITRSWLNNLIGLYSCIKICRLIFSLCPPWDL